MFFYLLFPRRYFRFLVFLGAWWGCAALAPLASAQILDPIDTAAEIVGRAVTARESLQSGRVSYREIIGTTVKSESRIHVVFDGSSIRTERITTAAGAGGAPAVQTRQGAIRNGALWTQYSGTGNDPANWRVHSEVFDPSEDSEATGASYDPRLFRTGALPRTWSPRSRLREYMSLPYILLTEPIVGQTPTGAWLLAGRRKRPFDAEIVFECDERRAWSILNIQVTRRVPLADGSLERWVHKSVVEPEQYGEFWFPARFVMTKEVDGKLRQRCELATSAAEFNIEIEPHEFTLRGIKGLPSGVRVTRNFEGNETRIWNGTKLVESGTRP